MVIETFNLKPLTSPVNIKKIKYKVIHSLTDFEKRFKCIFIKSLHPDYYLLFGSVNLIITEKGSPLSHLAIVGREHNMPIFLAKDLIKKIPEKGTLSITNNSLEIETKK